MTNSSKVKAVKAGKKGSFPHKYRRGQVLYWGNGAEVYVRVVERNPLHCDGGSPSYKVHVCSESHWDVLGPHYAPLSPYRGYVSEEVLRPLTALEIGV